MKSQITLSQAIDGYLLDAHARQLSPKTIADYSTTFRKFRARAGDPPLRTITRDTVREFLAELRTHPVSMSHGVAPRPARRLSKKTVLNIHIGLSALWSWAVREGFADTNIVRAIKAPRPEQKVIEPYSQEDVSALLTCCEHTAAYTRPGKSQCANSRPTALRDRAVILLLLDTGMRAGEMCADPKRGTPGLLVRDLDLREPSLKVFGKGDKERILPISPSTSKTIWRYLATRPDAAPDEPLFLSTKGGAFTVGGLGQLLTKLGRRADVQDAHPHRFRHTFAINLLRNGANAYELQAMLGHTSLEMVKRYLKLAQVDIEAAHKRASPVANWHL